MATLERYVHPGAVVRAVALLLLVAGCERSPGVTGRDTTAAAVPAPGAAAAAPAASTWDASAGPVLLVAGESGNDAMVVFPQFTDSTLTDSTRFDVSGVRDVRFDLFARAGSAGTGTLAPRDDSTGDEGCVSWPVMAVRPVGDASLAAWTVGFASGRAETIPLDSIEALPPADSARLAAEAARLASSLPSDTAEAFRGIPFFVRTVRRFTIPPRTQALVAEVQRRVNQEASPREEQILIVAERDSGQTSGHYTVAYYDRAAGTEESVETVDVLAAVLLGDGRQPALVLSRDDGDGTAYALLERTGPRRWAVRWASAYTGCGE